MNQVTITHGELAKLFGMSGAALHSKMTYTGDTPKRFIPPQRDKAKETFHGSPLTPRWKKNFYEYNSAMKFFEQHKDWVKTSDPLESRHGRTY